MYRLIILLVTISGILEASMDNNGGNQHFLQKPTNQTVREGGDLTLKCVVGNLKGNIQWTRNEFGLGPTQETVASTCANCRMRSPERGISILEVSNVRLGEDEKYECQVSPGSSGVKVLLRAPVHINIQVPPTQVRFTTPDPVIEGVETVIACTALSSKPATNLIWYRDDVIIRDAEIEEETLEGARPGTLTTISRMRYLPTPADNGIYITCAAEHPAIISVSEREHLRRKAKLRVLFAPKRGPEIRGNLSPNKRKGDIITLNCTSEGGNPLPELIWLRDDHPINAAAFPKQKTKKIQGSRSESILKFEASPKDNNVSFSCVSRSPVMEGSLPSENRVSFRIDFPPKEVKIIGPRSGRVGSILNFNCTAFNGSPAPKIEWAVNGEAYKAMEMSVQSRLDRRKGGYIVYSGISIPIQDTNAEEISLTCSAVSVGHAGDIMKVNDKMSVVVLKPPSQPKITGLPESKALREGEKVQLTCSSSDGSPQPRVRWFLGDSLKEIQQSVFSRVPIPHSKLNITVSRFDNERLYRCSARNDANHDQPSSKTVSLQVFFPPDSVKLSIERPRSSKSSIVQSNAVNQYSKKKSSHFFSSSPEATVIEGEFLRIVCKSAISNPAAMTEWRINNLPRTTKEVKFEPSRYKGFRTVSVIELIADHKDDGKIFQCFARNPSFEKENKIVQTNLTLNVLYAPKFSSKTLGTFSMVEGDTRNITLRAVGNPSEIKYEWKFPPYVNASSRFLVYKSSLVIRKAHRTDSGIYKIYAANSYGNFTSVETIKIDVQFPPRIVFMSPNLTVEEHSTVEFHCKAEANPLSDKTIAWKFENEEPIGLLTTSNMRSEIRMVNDTSVLTIISAHRGNTGFVQCFAKNNISERITSKKSYLTVNHKPWIIKKAPLNKFAVPKGDPAELICRATGVPNVKFTWEISHGGRTTVVLPIDQYKGESIKPKRLYKGFRYTWDSVLRLDNVRPEYYTTAFRCIAYNQFGNDTHVVSILPRGKPDPPTDVRALASDHDSVTLTWEPGFDGGYNQTYFVIVTEERTGNIVQSLLNTEDISKNISVIKGLKPKTPYSFKVLAKNKVGKSLPGGEVIKKTEAMKHALPQEDGILPRVAIIGIVISAIIAFVIVLVIATCFIKQRKTHGRRDRNHVNKKRKSGSDNPVTIERYTPTKYSNAMSDELFFPSSYEKPRSSSVCSSNQPANYREMARSFSVPGPGSEEDTESSYNGPHDSGMRHQDTLQRNLPKGWRKHSFSSNGGLEEDESDFLHRHPRTSSKEFFTRITPEFHTDEVRHPPPPRLTGNGFVGNRRRHHTSTGYSISSITPIFHPRRRESATPSPLPQMFSSMKSSFQLTSTGESNPPPAFTLPRKDTRKTTGFTNPYNRYWNGSYRNDEDEPKFYRNRLMISPLQKESESSSKSFEDDDLDLICPPPPPPPLAMTGTARRQYAQSFN